MFIEKFYFWRPVEPIFVFEHRNIKICWDSAPALAKNVRHPIIRFRRQKVLEFLRFFFRISHDFTLFPMFFQKFSDMSLLFLKVTDFFHIFVIFWIFSERSGMIFGWSLKVPAIEKSTQNNCAKLFSRCKEVVIFFLRNPKIEVWGTALIRSKVWASDRRHLQLCSSQVWSKSAG